MIRRAKEEDLPYLNKLLYQVHKVHHEVRPDLFKDGTKKYTDSELIALIHDDLKPIFVYEFNNEILGYAFCVHIEHINDNNLTDIKTLYIDDLCVDENARGQHIGTKLYEYVLDYARKQGYYEVTLNVWADNKKALKFYESIGLRVQKIGMEKIL